MCCCILVGIGFVHSQLLKVYTVRILIGMQIVSTTIKCKAHENSPKLFIRNCKRNKCTHHYYEAPIVAQGAYGTNLRHRITAQTHASKQRSHRLEVLRG